MEKVRNLELGLKGLTMSQRPELAQSEQVKQKEIFLFAFFFWKSH